MSECDGCREKHSIQNASADSFGMSSVAARFPRLSEAGANGVAVFAPFPGHDFNRVPVYPEHQQLESTDRKILTTQQVAVEDEPTEETADDGVLLDLQKKKAQKKCQQDGGASACNPAKGTYGLKRNENTCCTKGCTNEHEVIHKKDSDEWGCCAAFSKAYKAKGADKNALIDKYNEWNRKVRSLTECHAYSHDIDCADALAKEKDCEGEGKDTDCCNDIAIYKRFYGKLAKENCDLAPAAPEPCPAFA